MVAEADVCHREGEEMRLLFVALLASLLLCSCGGTIAKTNNVWAASFVVGNAQMDIGPQCGEADDCEGVHINGGEVSETFASSFLSPVVSIARSLLTALAGM